jgi:hypothetical protein
MLEGRGNVGTNNKGGGMIPNLYTNLPGPTILLHHPLPAFTNQSSLGEDGFERIAREARQRATAGQAEP